MVILFPSTKFMHYSGHRFRHRSSQSGIVLRFDGIGDQIAAFGTSTPGTKNRGSGFGVRVRVVSLHCPYKKNVDQKVTEK